MEQISRSAEGERVARERLEALYPAGEVNGTGIAAKTASNGETARQLTSLLSSISIAFGDDDVRDEVVERFLWKMGRSEQRRQILYALDFLRALHAVAGPPPEVFDQLRDLLARYKLDAGPLTELEQLVGVVEQCGVPREQIVLNLFPENLAQAVAQNQILQVAIFSILFGSALAMIPEPKRAPLITVLQSLADGIKLLTKEAVTTADRPPDQARSACECTSMPSALTCAVAAIPAATLSRLPMSRMMATTWSSGSPHSHSATGKWRCGAVPMLDSINGPPPRNFHHIW